MNAQSSRRIEDLHPALRPKAQALLTECSRRGVRLMITSTLRSCAHQRALYAQGRLAIAQVNALRADAGMGPVSAALNCIVTHAERSMHELGLAFDVAVIDSASPTWDASADTDRDAIPDYEEAGAVGESLGLTWGGRFRMRDLCHFEWSGGLTREEVFSGLMPPEGAEAAADAGRAHGKANSQKEETMAETVKSGVKSSEFYVALLGAVVPVLNSYLGLAIPVEGLLSIAGVVASYIISRAAVKRK